jgi:UDP-glucuronate 4-epimerase
MGGSVVGNSHPVKLSELVCLLERATGKKAAVQREAPQQGDCPPDLGGHLQRSETARLRPHTSLDEGLKKFVAWYRAADPVQRA